MTTAKKNVTNFILQGRTRQRGNMANGIAVIINYNIFKIYWKRRLSTRIKFKANIKKEMAWIFKWIGCMLTSIFKDESQLHWVSYLRWNESKLFTNKYFVCEMKHGKINTGSIFLEENIETINSYF